MYIQLHRLGLYALLLLLFFSCATTHKNSNESVSSIPNAAKEFRAAWVATVANINWPSKPGLTTEQQQQEAITLLDFLKAHNFNAVIFQVRPQGDALYQSSLEPWSYFLSGVQGKAPEPFYDPLSFWVNAAHERGLELHVWLNPYRAHHVSGGEVSDSSVVKKMPNLVVKLKEGYWWFDPSLKGTQDHGVAVVMDIVKRYDIDGVHFDDYFYPYPSYNANEDFPDTTSWKQYIAGGGKLSRGDWRRESVNTFIQRLYKEIKAEKKHVKFGLSPFGTWRPGHPEGVVGFDQYDQLYADAKLWLNKGWIDYFSPQLYWPINRIPLSFPVLLGWMANEARPYKQHVPVRITVHHEGGRVLGDTADAMRRLKNVQVWSMGKDRNWTDIPYHYLVAPDGTVFEGRNAYTVGETNTEYDPSGHLLICFLGNYQEQELNQQSLDVLTKLIAYCCKKYSISHETIATHRDHSKQTTCPGKNIYPYFENGYVKKRVNELLQKE